MADFAERFTAAFDVVSDYGGYVDADIVSANTPDAIGISVELDGLGDYKKLVYRSVEVSNPQPNQKCGTYGLIEVRGDDVNAVLLGCFADGTPEETVYYYRQQKLEDESRPERVLCLIESALGKLLISRDK